MRCLARGCGALLLLTLGLGASGCLFKGNYSHPGGYIGLGYSQALEDFDLPGGVEGDDAPGADFRFGYRGNANFAAEFVLDWNDDMIEDLDSDAWTISGNLKFYPLNWWPEYSRVQPYIVGGAGGQWIDIATPGQGHEGSFVWRYGAGLDVYFCKSALLYTEIAGYENQEDDFDDLNLYHWNTGITFRFGG